jgi:cation diffusion facilitator CzcD-associated flavoprotein CzcO
MATMSQMDHDVIIIGAGLAGINGAYRIQTECPNLSYTILEARHCLGGTWDLFKYPGIRSDSDLTTFGFTWRPWSENKAIAPGPLIKKYLEESAEEYGIDKKIQYHHKVLHADWSSTAQRWTLHVESEGTRKLFSARFVFFCAGYYDYDEPLQVQIPGIQNFKGTTVHPQFWPEDLDYTNKKIVVIGSGATAITLLPNLAEKAEHVTMLQRSPSYIISLSSVDPAVEFFRRWFPVWIASTLVRWKAVVIPFVFYYLCTFFPNAARNMLLKRSKALLPADMPLDPDFLPDYYPWEQRLGICPDGDFYECLKTGAASILTGNIEMIDEKSIKIKETGQLLHPDIIITATGLKLAFAAGARITVDKEPIIISSKHLWKGVMLQDVPNTAFALGYTHASWTLGADATAIMLARMINYMQSKDIGVAIPRMGLVDPAEETKMRKSKFMDMKSTYLSKGRAVLPLAGDRAPWKPRVNYFSDLWDAKWGNLNTGMEWIGKVHS